MTKKELAENNNSTIRGINKDITRMIEGKDIGEEDRLAAKFILTWMNCGPRIARDLIGVSTITKNLEDMGFINGEKLAIGGDDYAETFISFCLALSGARRHISCN